MLRTRRRQSAFTLIELMVVVAIVAILAAVALPAYFGSLRKGHRADAQSYLMDLAQRQQQYFTDNRAFATSLTLLNDPVPSSVSAYYTIGDPVAGTIAAPTQTTPPAFTITGTAIGSQAVDGNLQIDSTGVKTPSNKW